MLPDKLVLSVSKKIKTYFSFPKKEKVTLTKYNSTENIEALKVNTDEAKTVKITREDLEKSFKLHEEKLIILAQKLSSQISISNDDYNPVTEYRYVEELGKIVPFTEL